jgi:hypothetical protein
MLQRKKFENQYVTKPEPFVFETVDRPLRPPPEEDTDDFR